jgi:hypothetical protein
MSIRRFAVAVSALLTTVALSALLGFGGVVNVAHATPSAVGAPHEGAKVTLGETSIDGPAIMGTPSSLGTVIAWTGTDPSHSLNLMTSTDGLHYTNKHTLPETSLWRPAIAFIDSARTGPYGTIILAWTGTDPAHTLNIEFISLPTFTVSEKVTFWGETSFTAPSVASINGDINSDVYLAWAGTDTAHTLNVLHRMWHSSPAPDKHTLWGWSSISRPNITQDQSPSSTIAMILSWTTGNGRIAFADTTDRVHWTMPSASPLTYQSAWAPSMIAFFVTDPTTMPTHWLAWTGAGTTSTHSINVAYTQSFPTWGAANSTVALPETAISSPALAYNGDGTTQQVLIAWAGTDPAHHLNIAFVTV